MADRLLSETAQSGPTDEVYSQRDNPAFEALLATNTADREAAFFLPYLRPGMQVLDVGSGPGSITLGLAGVVAPGVVVGIDVVPAQVEQARALAGERGVTNVHFEVADLYRLPFPDGSFDAAFAHTVFMGLREPVRALAELKRVLRPGGVIGLRDPDEGADIMAPTTPLLGQWHALKLRVRQHNGGDPFAGRRHRGHLLAAGFARAEATASVRSAGSLEETRRRAVRLKAQLLGLARTGLAEGWIDQPAVDAMMGAIDEWAERPDAFSAVTCGEAIGWVSD